MLQGTRSVVRRGQDGFSLIELLVVILIVAVLIALLLPAVQSAREAARRAQCAGNLRQLALGTLNYQDALGGFPPGGFYRPAYTRPDFGTKGNSWLVHVLPFIEQASLYASYNQNLNWGNLANLTGHATGIASLWCPSDGTVGRTERLPADSVFFPWEAAGHPAPVSVAFSSYAACTGAWFGQAFPDVPDWRAINASNTGLVFLESDRRLSDVTDGTSHTIFLGERGHGLLVPERRSLWHWWPAPTRTLFTTQWPMNPHKRVRDGQVAIGPIFMVNPTVFLLSASSFHPGGCQFAFVDGSVRFLRETIDSWPVDAKTVEPLGLVRDDQGVFSLRPGARLGVYQALSTIRGGEVLQGE